MLSITWGFLPMRELLSVRLAGVLIKSGEKCCPVCKTRLSESKITFHETFIIFTCPKCKRKFKLDYAPPLKILLDKSDLLFYNEQYREMLLSCKCSACNLRGLALDEDEKAYCLNCDTKQELQESFQEFCDSDF